MSLSSSNQWRREADGGSSRFGRAQQEGVGAVDLMYLYSVLRSNARLIVLVTLATIVAMFAYLQTVPPTYSAWSQVLMDTREERVAPAVAVVSNLDVTNSVIAGEVVTLRSNVLLGEVVDELDLVNAPEFDPRQLRRESFLALLKRVARGGEPPHVVAARMPESMLRAMVVDAIRRDLEVTQIGISYAIGIRFQSNRPEVAARIANAVADRYIASQLSNKLDATLRANAWLADRLEELSAQVETADGAVVDFKAEMIDMAQGSEDSINQLLAELNTRLVASSTERADAEVRFGQIEALMSGGGLTAVADVVTSPLLENLQRRRAELASEQAQLASTLGRKHPDMVSISAQIENIDRSIQEELHRKVEEMRSDVVVTRNRETALQGQIEVVSDRADALSKASVRLSQLERSAEATRLVYENFLSRYKETSAQADFQTPEARVIGRAEIPTVPSAPRKTLMMIGAMVLGFSAAVALVFLRNMVRAPVSSESELTALSRLPNFGLLPYVGHFGGGFGWLRRELSDDPKSTFMEHVKSIQTVLFDDKTVAGSRHVMITSSVPNEGKTALSVALAKSLSKAKYSVVLLDADLRQPDLRQMAGITHKEGCLVDFLESNKNLKDIVQYSEVYGINVVSPARPCTAAADLLSSPQFDKLLSRLKSRYSTVIVNAPPVLYLADAVLLGKKVGVTLMTVQCGRTPARVVRNSIQRLETAEVEVEGTVLTMVRKIDTAARETEMYSYGY
ncbi:GumC family protein [Marimonas lutisalis]|uniref:GumC family protein n=1 Tax=Marimonas lutisalis TaxID=2545756 RepID=UPI0010F69187|nr:GNVR domain-containing protein [Marimonas lutisalis]